jgi:long-chain acyl-CoA synthetase
MRIMQFPGLAECAVIGIPDDKWGEAVQAIVVSRQDKTPDPAGIIAHCRGLIAAYKCPRTVVVWAESLPKSGAGKTQKFALWAPFWIRRDRTLV